MKSIFGALIICLFWLQAHSQSVMNVSVNDGQQNNKETEIGSYDSNGKKTGEWKIFAESYSRVGKYLDGKKTGEWRTFDKRGNIAVIGFYEEGLETGEWKTYFPDGKVVYTIVNYKNGKRNGPSYEFNEDGIREEKQEYVDGKKDGVRELYNEDGTIYLRGNWKNDKKTGEEIQFYKDGKKKVVEKYDTNGRLVLFKQYHSNGQLLKEERWKDGKLMEVIQLFDKNGNKLDKGTLKKGNGTVRNYSEDGKFLSEQVFVDGVKKD